MNYGVIVKIIGRILCVEAAFMIPAMIISFACGETLPALCYLGTIAVMAVIGLPCGRMRLRRRGFYAREGFITVGLAWIVVSLFGALPFWLSGEIPHFVDAFFETVSGFTTTGASILREVEPMSTGLLYWRSFTHWLGGMGVLVFVLAIGPITGNENGNALYLLQAESPGPQVSKLVPRLHHTAKILYGIYIVLTIIQILLLLLGDMPVFDAVTTAFATAGTGGFAIRTSSMADYSAYCQTVTAIFMILFGVNFSAYYLILIRNFRRLFRNEEVRTYLLIIIAAILIIAFNIRHMFADFGQALHHSAFQVASIITTTGFATTDFNLWPELSRAVLVGLMIIGACAGSTGGGIKVSRLLIMFKAAKQSIYRTLRPNNVRLMHMDGELVEDSTVTGVYGFLTLYFIISAVSVLLISLDNFSFDTSFTAVMACINNVGPGLGAVGPAANYADFSILSKLILTFNMLLGRLELYPLIILFTPSVWKK